jgi:hypothetical protein
MRKIKMVGDRNVLIDNEDYEEASKYRWYPHSGGYAFRWGKANDKPKALFLHKMVCPTKKGQVVWFRDGNVLNVTRANLLAVSKSMLSHLSSGKESGSSKYKGVIKGNNRNKWGASIIYDKKSYCIGTFSNERDAALAYDHYARKFYKTDDGLNFPNKTVTLEWIEECLRKERKKSSQYRGVSYNSNKKIWRCRIIHKGVHHDLGSYKDEKEAAQRYDVEARRLLKSKAKLNFPK